MNKSWFHLLHVDDDQSDAFFFERALKQCVHDSVAHWVPSGQSAIVYLNDAANPRPNLILCDVKMPGMSGFELLKWLRTSRYRRIPIVMLSGSVLTTDVNLAFELGANAYVGKPGAPEELVKVVKRTIEFWCNTCVLPAPVEGAAHVIPKSVAERLDQPPSL